MKSRSEIVDKGSEIYEAGKQRKDFTLDVADAELKEWIDQNPETIDTQKIAHSTIKLIDERSRFKPRKEQLELWPEEILEDTIPNGEPRGRIMMKNAKDQHLDAWDEVEKENFFHIVTAFENGRSMRLNLKKELRPNETVGQCYARKQVEAAQRKKK